MQNISVGQTITIQQYADADNNTLSYYRNAYLFYLDVTLNYQDIINNVSNITVRHRMTPKKSYYSSYNGVGSRLSINEEQVATYDLRSCTLNTNYILTQWTGDVAHDQEGNLSLDIDALWHGFDNNHSYSAVSNTISDTFVFPQILRTSGLAVTPALLQKGGTMAISLTRYVNTYRDTVKWNVNGGTDHVLQTKGTGTSFSVPYATIEAVLGTHTSGQVKVIVETYSGNTLLGTAKKSITIQTGVVALSLYDDMEGNVGLCVGEEAPGPGFRVKLDNSTPLPMDDYVVEQGTSGNWNYRKWASGIAECWGSFAHSTKMTTAWGSLYTSTTTFPQQSYPFVFISKPLEQVSVMGDGSASAWAVNLNSSPNTASKSAAYSLVRSTTQLTTAYTYYVNLDVKGRWK